MNELSSSELNSATELLRIPLSIQNKLTTVLSELCNMKYSCSIYADVLFVTVTLTCLVLFRRLADSKLLSLETKMGLMTHPHSRHTVEQHDDNGAAILFSKGFPSILSLIYSQSFTGRAGVYLSVQSGTEKQIGHQ